MSFNVHISISFNREGLSIDRNLQSITDASIILLGLLGGFTANCICFIKLGAPVFRAHLFRIMFSSRPVTLISTK